MIIDLPPAQTSNDTTLFPVLSEAHIAQLRELGAEEEQVEAATVLLEEGQPTISLARYRVRPLGRGSVGDLRRERR